MARHDLKVLLKFGDALFSERELTSSAAEWTVGRRSDADVCVPAEDTSVSGRHLRVFVKNGNWFLEDAGSRNGVFLRGKRLSGPVKLKDGDVFTFGNCSLLVQEATRVGTVTNRPHKLEAVNGDAAGETYDVVAADGAPFVIGLDPGCSLPLANPLVSRKHCQLTLDPDGTCWIVDLGSRNGTLVNNEPLKDRRRLLRDGDIVTVACFDFRFWDRSVNHTRVFLWVKLLALAAALAVMAGGYVLWSVAGLSVEERLAKVRAAAAEKDFDRARAELDEAKLAREAETFRPQIDALDLQIDRWRKTCSEWESAQQAMLDGDLRNARRLLESLNGCPMDAWAWNGAGAAVARQQADFAARVLRIHGDATEALYGDAEDSPERQAELLASKLDPIAALLDGEREVFDGCAFGSALTNELSRVRRDLAAVKGGFEFVDACIGRLDAVNPDFSTLAKRLTATAQDEKSGRVVRAYARKYAVPCQELALAKAFVQEEFDAITDLRFAEVLSRRERLLLPDKALCQRHPKLSDHRAKLQGHHQDVQRLAGALAAMKDGLDAELFGPKASGAALLAKMFDPKVWQSVLAFDCFDKAPPSARRKESSGVYDEMLGIEYAYETLAAEPQDYGGRCLKMIGFTPQCITARHLLQQVSAFVSYVDGQRKWLQAGKMGEFVSTCRSILSARDALVRRLASAKGADRVALVSRAFSQYLAETPDIRIRAELAADFKVYRQKISALSDAYDAELDPNRLIERRREMLKKGIPGDPAIHPKWVQEHEVGK